MNSEFQVNRFRSLVFVAPQPHIPRPESRLPNPEPRCRRRNGQIPQGRIPQARRGVIEQSADRAIRSSAHRPIGSSGHLALGPSPAEGFCRLAVGTGLRPAGGGPTRGAAWRRHSCRCPSWCGAAIAAPCCSVDLRSMPGQRWGHRRYNPRRTRSAGRRQKATHSRGVGCR